MLWIDYEEGPPYRPNLIYQLANKLQPGIIINNRLDVLHTDMSRTAISALTATMPLQKDLLPDGGPP